MKEFFITILFGLLILCISVIAVEDVRVIDAGDTWFEVAFNTSTETGGSIVYGTSYYSLSDSATFSSSFNHVVTIEELDANTLYYYDLVIDGETDDNEGRHYRFVTNIGSGDSYFMSNKGDDSDSGSFAEPWKTIVNARDNMEAGDTLLIMDGTYIGAGENVGVVFREENSGEPGNPIVYRAYNKGYGMHPVFDAEFSVDTCSDYHCYVFKTLRWTHDLVFDSIWVRNVIDEMAETGGFIQRYSDRIDFYDCYVSDMVGGDRTQLSGAFMFCGTKDSNIVGARAWNLHGEETGNKGGINLYYGSGEQRYATNVTTRMSELWDCDAGVQVKSWGQEDAVFENNFFHDILD